MLISWNTTNACNLYCRHCYRAAGDKLPDELTTDEAREFIRSAADAGFKIMIFSGGEPLLRPDLSELVQQAVTCQVRPVLGTNGTLIDGKMAERLKKWGVAAAGISLDSIDPTQHDHLRGQSGAWQAAVEGMEACRRAGLPFQVHTTVFSFNEREIVDLARFAVDRGAQAFHVFFLVFTGRASEMSPAETVGEEGGREEIAKRYEQLITTLLKLQKQLPIEIKPTCAPQFMRIAHQLGIKQRFSRGCLAGIAYCLVNPRGQVQPCAYLDIQLGNVRERPFSAIWRESEVFLQLRSQDYGGKCGICHYHRICGGCRARAYAIHGDFMAEEPWCTYRPEGGKNFAR